MYCETTIHRGKCKNIFWFYNCRMNEKCITLCKIWPNKNAKTLPLYSGKHTDKFVDLIFSSNSSFLLRNMMISVFLRNSFCVTSLNIAMLSCREFWNQSYTHCVCCMSTSLFEILKLCLADAIHNFKLVKTILIRQNANQLFLNLADWCHVLSSTCLKMVLIKNEYNRDRRLKG